MWSLVVLGLGAAGLLGGQPVLGAGASVVAQPFVRAAAGRQVLVGYAAAGLEVEGDVADRACSAGLRAEPGQFLLDAESVEPVGEIPDGLVVVEVRLPHPTLGLRAAHDEPVRE